MQVHVAGQAERGTGKGAGSARPSLDTQEHERQKGKNTGNKRETDRSSIVEKA